MFEWYGLHERMDQAMLTPRVSQIPPPLHASILTSDFGPLPGPNAPDAIKVASMPGLVRASLHAVPEYPQGDEAR